jgi:hypothetical protein
VTPGSGPATIMEGSHGGSQREPNRSGSPSPEARLREDRHRVCGCDHASPEFRRCQGALELVDLFRGPGSREPEVDDYTQVAYT